MSSDAGICVDIARMDAACDRTTQCTTGWMLDVEREKKGGARKGAQNSAHQNNVGQIGLRHCADFSGA